MERRQLTLGILAGGEGRRLGGVDKAWAEFGGEPLVLRQCRRLGDVAARILVSANRNLERYPEHGLAAVPDRLSGFQGPLAGIDALLSACRTPWLVTVPVDAWDVDGAILHALLAACGDAAGAVAVEPGGPQPMLAAYAVRRCRGPVEWALADGERAVQRVQAALGFPTLVLERAIGNLNTPEAFARAQAGMAVRE
ncbi:molybdenum cofactor guanylyltransferase [Coralloluteibacterium thermophilus]|uniref:Molybdenum cofactor guanylyltransferase n=1 Tax=Coralloluteibacterium thermophilum TaxID=2707049 RepID=A0ABV9NIH1_9GAMM